MASARALPQIDQTQPDDDEAQENNNEAQENNNEAQRDEAAWLEEAIAKVCEDIEVLERQVRRLIFRFLTHD